MTFLETNMPKIYYNYEYITPW